MENKALKFSIVTPVYNGEKYLRETLESIFSQEGDFEIESIVVDGGSSDSTLSIAREYKEKIESHAYPLKCNAIEVKIISEKDEGMYDAINKGFKIATGDIYAWINSDDCYKQSAFRDIASVFKAFSDISWVKGITSFSENETYTKGKCFVYNQDWLAKGYHGTIAYFVHQDSVFWKKSLWNKVGSIPVKYKYAGDYWLWIQFAKYSPLFSLNTPVSVFRKREGQLSADMTRYREEQKKIAQVKGVQVFIIKLFFMFSRFSPQTISDTLYRILFPKRMREFINIENEKPVKKIASSYVI